MKLKAIKVIELISDKVALNVACLVSNQFSKEHQVIDRIGEKVGDRINIGLFGKHNDEVLVVIYFSEFHQELCVSYMNYLSDSEIHTKCRNKNILRKLLRDVTGIPKNKICFNFNLGWKGDYKN